jgi:hypothetical protein
LTLAQSLAEQAVSRLYENGWFQGAGDSHFYESVDGVGYLFLSLIELETGKPVPTFAASFYRALRVRGIREKATAFFAKAQP